MSDPKPLSREKIEALRRATLQAATAFAEDLEHIRKTLDSPTDIGDTRRLSNVLRRLLVNGELHKIAAPRIGRFIIDADRKSVV